MPYKEVRFKAEAQSKVLRGASQLADAVRITLGPKSHSVLIQRKWGKPIVCNDGVTVAKEIDLKDPVENLGAQMLREVAERTGDKVGDGTSTATILAFSILSEGIRNIAAGASAIDLKRGLDKGLQVVTKTIERLSRKMQTEQEQIHVASISAHNDESIGNIVAKAIQAVGADGAVSVEEGTGTETKLEVVEGMQFDRGYRSAYFVTDPARMEAILEKPYILIYEKKLTTIESMVQLLEKVLEAHRPLLIIAEDVEGEALATLVVNKMKGSFPCVAVQAPAFGDRRKAMLEDIAVLTGGKLISEDLGIKVENVTLTDLGQAARVQVTKDATTIIGGDGKKTAIEERAEQIRHQIQTEHSDYEKEKLRERLSKLTGGVAVIRVGAMSESEMKSRKEAYDDAISATKAAIAEGIVPGGGLALLRAIDSLEAEAERSEGDMRTGILILKKALEAPARQIAENSGEDGGVVVAEMRKSEGDMGFDAARKIYTDLMRSGIIDPAKVVRIALENAVSVAGLLLLTQATITENAEEKEKPSHPMEESAALM
ncbi:MAG: chaperonin GroEL [Bdellovibrionota bacterium]